MIIFVKENFCVVVLIVMTDDEIIKLVWGVMVLKQRFEIDPYSLSLDQIKLLKNQDNTQTR
ncbi:MAG TPA: hypothetical protein DCL66_05045 [Gammaproteobacteria bacterium]|nr:hypothetical protein [Gammaproteobacteria bacterium]